ncbi:4a-hydroxytetrahydrobiopterin dehydratase [Celeribacter sp.]|uniref:4a-hydroxytetrahydrobiopterin dehydratase n=1 Tax=Celeribacter sp. TaxID=1890673 RepID=UPI003A9265A0
MTDPLSASDAQTLIAPLQETGWDFARDGRAITKTFVFAGFVSAFDWMTRVARIAEDKNHHPEWTNVYKTVTVTLTTHDAKGLTLKDITLAQEMDKAVQI